MCGQSYQEVIEIAWPDYDAIVMNCPPSLAKEFQSLKQCSGSRPVEGARDLVDNQNLWLLQKSQTQKIIPGR